MAKSTISRSSQNNGKTILRAECRVCLKNDGNLPIFGDEGKPDISMEISTFGGIQLYENDNMPKFICEDCFKLLEGAISFRKSAKRADALLKRRNKKKEEIEGSFKVKSEDIKLETEAPKLYTQIDELNEFTGESTIMFVVNDEKVNMEEPKIDFVSVEMAEPSENITYSKNERAIDGNEETHEDGLNHDETDSDDEPLLKTDNKKKLDNKDVLDSFNCKYCSLIFQSLDAYEKHRTTVEHKRNYVMSFLPKKKKKLLSSQVKRTVNPKDHICDLCNRQFTKLHYPRHMLSEHNIRMETARSPTKKECTVCKKLFHPAALNNHIKKIHGNEKDMKPKVKLECPICKKLFSKHFYPLHMQRHKQGDTRNYVCDQCGKKFFFKSSFFTHRLIHTNELPHKCEYCPYRGRTKELLKIHVRTHTGDYPYKCNQCDTRCLTKSNLNSHMRRHRGPIDFICDACNRGFYSKIQLERHISVSHYGVKNHICSICGAAFGYRHGLMSHQRKVHKRPKGLGKPKAVYLQLEEEGILQPEQEM